jgi:hypothetical protein
MNATKPKGRKATEAQAKPTPETLRSHVLAYCWSTSRGRDTYGYNLLTLREDGAKVADACGGGYDMTGAALADWLEKAYPVRLLELARTRAGSIWSEGKPHVSRTDRGGYEWTADTDGTERRVWKDNPNFNPEALYGLSYNPDKQTASLDGACGVRSVEEVLKALGLQFKEDGGNWNRRTGRRLDRGIYLIRPLEA